MKTLKTLCSSVSSLLAKNLLEVASFKTSKELAPTIQYGWLRQHQRAWCRLPILGMENILSMQLSK